MEKIDVMTGPIDDFGPWLKPNPPVGFCPFCKENKENSDIYEFILDEDVEQIRNLCNVIEDVKYPFVLCRVCKVRFDKRMKSVDEFMERIGFKKSYE